MRGKLVAEPEGKTPEQQGVDSLERKKERRRYGLVLLRRLLIYHTGLAVVLIATAALFPSFIAQLPIGGIDRRLSSRSDESTR
jgi:hypothetical protein